MVIKVTDAQQREAARQFYCRWNGKGREDLEKSGERQWVNLDGRKVNWLRLERMIKSDDPSAFPSLRAWEVYGK